LLKKDKLKTLINIAKRRNKVDDIIETTEIVKTVKQITKLDKERLGYKPEKGQNQWTRNCQNSGDNKKRRPIPYTDKNIDEIKNQMFAIWDFSNYIIDKVADDDIWRRSRGEPPLSSIAFEKYGFELRFRAHH
jgi:hypothetical protein